MKKPYSNYNFALIFLRSIKQRMKKGLSANIFELNFQGIEPYKMH
jgi:hypothetical protein